MGINFGSDKIKEIYHGSDKIKEVYHGGELVWKLKSDLVLFESNNINLGFEEGYFESNGIGSVYIGDDKMRIETKYGEYRIVSSQKYDLSNFNEVVIEWEQTEDVANARSLILFPTIKKSSTSSSDRYVENGLFARSEYVYSISHLTGLRYVEISLSPVAVQTIILNIYKITLR